MGAAFTKKEGGMDALNLTESFLSVKRALSNCFCRLERLFLQIETVMVPSRKWEAEAKGWSGKGRSICRSPPSCS